MSMQEQQLSLASTRLRWSGRLLLKLLKKITQGSLILTDPQGSSIELGQPGASPHASLHIYDWRAAGLILRQGDVGFAESLRRGWIDSPNLLALFTLALRNEQVSEAVDGHWWALLLKQQEELQLEGRRVFSELAVAKLYSSKDPRQGQLTATLTAAG